MCLQGGFFSKCSCLEPIDWVSRGLGFWAEASSPGLNMRLHQLSQGLQWPMLSLPGPVLERRPLLTSAAWHLGRGFACLRRVGTATWLSHKQGQGREQEPHTL